jgi:cold shock CspA family protein
MGRSQETFGKKEVKSRKDKKRKEKEQKRSLRKTEGKKRSFDEMIAYVDEFGKISSTPPDPDKKTIVDPDSIELTATRNKPVSGPGEDRKGIVTYFVDSKGFGFIKDLESGEEIFVHVSNLTEPIKEGDRVEFAKGKGPKGVTAIKVRLIKE